MARSCHRRRLLGGVEQVPVREGLLLQRDLLGVRAEPARRPRRRGGVRDHRGLVTAATAWCTTRVRSGSGSASSAARIRALHRIRTATGRAASTARRDSSCRNATALSRTSTSPVRSAAASTPRSPSTARASGSPIPDGTTDSCSSAACSAGPRRWTRASTASTTVDGTVSAASPLREWSPDRATATISETKNGLPAVSR